MATKYNEAVQIFQRPLLRPGGFRIFRRNRLIFVIFFLSITAYLFYTSSVAGNRLNWIGWQNSSSAGKDQKTPWIQYPAEANNGQVKMACHIPHLNPFDETILQFLEEPKPANCENTKHPLIFTTDLESNLIQLVNTTSMGYQSCCYRKLEREEGTDRQTKLDENCKNITDSKTKIPSHVDFIVLSCLKNGTLKIVDFFQFVHLKSNVEERVEVLKRNSTTSRPLNTLSYKVSEAEVEFLRPRTANVVVLGLDGVSHMNFIRTMPRTYEYIRKNLSAHGLLGYTKIGQNTLPNIGAALTGKTIEELKETCWQGNHVPFDSCPFLWKNYEAAGYRTAFGEDAIMMGIFNFQKRGFNRQPTDYYNHAFMREFEKQLGHQELQNAKLCYGSRLGFGVSLDLLKKMAFTMDKTRKYFQFIWATSMTHDYLNQGKVGDKPLLETLQWFKEEGYLENTIFILMSDHGINYGDARKTFQGQLEARMPFVYFIIPQWFKGRYRAAMSNLIGNKNKLTSPFDLYETLKDLIDLKTITNIQDSYGVKRTEMPRGISLFLPIPAERTCADAEIPDHFCVCKARKPVDVENNPMVEEGARTVVTYINAMFTKSPQCLALSLKKVLNAQVFQIEEAGVMDFITNPADPRLKSQSITFTVAFEVHPSQGTFEATVTRDTHGTWKVSNEISRTNLYGNQSVCVTNNNLKKFCFCG